MEATFIQSVRTENTGGNIMVDFITLEDGKILAVCDYGVGLYANMDAFDNSDEPLQFFER